MTHGASRAHLPLPLRGRGDFSSLSHYILHFSGILLLRDRGVSCGTFFTAYGIVHRGNFFPTILA